MFNMCVSKVHYVRCSDSGVECPCSGTPWLNLLIAIISSATDFCSKVPLYRSG